MRIADELIVNILGLRRRREGEFAARVNKQRLDLNALRRPVIEPAPDVLARLEHVGFGQRSCLSVLQEAIEESQLDVLLEERRGVGAEGDVAEAGAIARPLAVSPRAHDENVV